MITKYRQLAISQQGLGAKHEFGNGINATKKVIEHLGYVQIDTLSVVERAHHHVLWSRLPDYQPDYLNQLVSQQAIFEYWFHAASYLPMRDYRFALPQMQAIRNGESPYFSCTNAPLMNEVLHRIRNEGALKARDIDNGVKSNGKSWSTRPVRRALDRLYMQGDLMVCARNGMEKVYDIAERCLPANINKSMPSDHEYAQYLFDTTLRAHGVFTWKQLIHLRKGKSIRQAMLDVLEAQIETGRINKIDIGNSNPIYLNTQINHDDASRLKEVKLLSPFDNVLIHRDRLNSLFNFDYRIECYLPAKKRVYGYFCLPILYKDSFVGRIDCKAHRAKQKFEVVNFHMECTPTDKQLFEKSLRKELQHFAQFNQCPNVEASLIKL